MSAATCDPDEQHSFAPFFFRKGIPSPLPNQTRSMRLLKSHEQLHRSSTCTSRPERDPLFRAYLTQRDSRTSRIHHDAPTGRGKAYVLVLEGPQVARVQEARLDPRDTIHHRRLAVEVVIKPVKSAFSSDTPDAPYFGARLSLSLSLHVAVMTVTNVMMVIQLPRVICDAASSAPTVLSREDLVVVLRDLEDEQVAALLRAHAALDPLGQVEEGRVRKELVGLEGQKFTPRRLARVGIVVEILSGRGVVEPQTRSATPRHHHLATYTTTRRRALLLRHSTFSKSRVRVWKRYSAETSRADVREVDFEFDSLSLSLSLGRRRCSQAT